MPFVLMIVKKYWVFIAAAIVVSSLYAYGRYEHAAAVKAKNDLSGCLQANVESKDTVEKLKSQISQNMSTCDKRISNEKQLCSDLQNVDTLSSKEVSTHETGTIYNASSPLLVALNGVWTTN